MGLDVFFDAIEELALMIYPMERTRLDLLLDTIIYNLDDTKP